MEKKPYRLSGYLLILLLTISVGGQPVTIQAEEPPAGKASGSDQSASKKQGNMSEMFKGTVVEAINAGRYAYIQIDTGEKRVWVAVPGFDGKPGDKVLVPPGVPVADFQSKKLNRRFEIIYFVGGIRHVGESAAEKPSQTLPEGNPPIDKTTEKQMTHPPMDELAQGPAIEIGKVEKAEDGRTVSEIITGWKSLAGKEIRVRAKVVKFTPNIMEKNWLHVRDGSGDEGTKDLIVTTKAMVNVGCVVLIRGIVSVDRDFGFGQKYRVIIEDAEVTEE